MSQMQYSLHILLGGLTVLALWRLYKWVHVYLMRYRLIRLYQCLPPARLPLNPFLLGLDFFLESLLAARSKKYLQHVQSIYHEYGNTFILQSSPFQPVIYTIEPANIKAILATKFTDYSAGSPRQKSFGPLLGSSIFLSDGQEWAHSRALLRPSFARSQVDDMPNYEKHVQNLIRAIPADRETAVDLSELFLKYTADVITEFMYGKSILSLSQPESFDSRLMKAFDEAQKGGEIRFQMGIFADWMPGQKNFWQSVKWLHDFMSKHVDEALRCHRDSKQELPKPSNDECSKEEMSRYIFLKEIAKLTDDPKVLRDELLSILFAGRDSTAATLTNLFFEISRRPEVWQLLRQEVAQKLNRGLPSFSNLSQMEYLHNCVNESRSLHLTAAHFLF